MERAITRRTLIGIAAAGGCLCSAAAQQPSCCLTAPVPDGSITAGPKTISIDLRQAPSLGTVGGSAMLAGQGIIIVRPEESRYVALASKCTHGGVVVTYNHRKRFLQCNSFGHSIFMLDGSVEKGPAKRPLKVYPATVNNGRLEIEL